MPGVSFSTMKAGRALLGIAGPRHDDEQIGEIGVSDISLRTVQHVSVGVETRRGLDAAGVGARLFLGQREGAGQLSGGQFRQVFPPLVLGAVPEDRLRRQAERRGEPRAVAGRGLGDRHCDQDLLLHGQPETAVFLRNGHPEKAIGAEFLDDLLGHAVRVVEPVLVRPQGVAGERLDAVQIGVEIGLRQGCVHGSRFLS